MSVQSSEPQAAAIPVPAGSCDEAAAADGSVGKDPRFKTELCQNFEIWGWCRYNGKCQFAHGAGELQSAPNRHPKYKTRLCKNFHERTTCPYGRRCHFIHGLPHAQSGASDTAGSVGCMSSSEGGSSGGEGGSSHSEGGSSPDTANLPAAAADQPPPAAAAYVLASNITNLLGSTFTDTIMARAVGDKSGRQLDTSGRQLDTSGRQLDTSGRQQLTAAEKVHVEQLLAEEEEAEPGPDWLNGGLDFLGNFFRMSLAEGGGGGGGGGGSHGTTDATTGVAGMMELDEGGSTIRYIN